MADAPTTEEVREEIERLRRELDGAAVERGSNERARRSSAERAMSAYALPLAEHRDALASEVVTIVRELGGEVEGLPTQTINYLQRIRALRAIEADRDTLAAEVERLRKAMKKRYAAGHNDTCAAMLGDYACSCGHDDLLRGMDGCDCWENPEKG